MPRMDISLTALGAINRGRDEAVLTGLVPVLEYDTNRKPIGTEPIAWRVEVALQGNKLRPASVKITGKKPPLPITDEEIQNGLDQDSPVLRLVSFEDYSAKIFNINGEQVISATAKAAILVDDELKL